MAWTATAEVDSGDAEVCASLLWDAGASGVELVDEETAPMPGVPRPTPGRTLLVGHFTREDDARRATEWLSLRGCEVATAELEERAWATDWRKHFHPLRISEKLWVAPSWDRPIVPRGAQTVIIDPGTAFGTGSHETTALCLRTLDGLLDTGVSSVLDVGTGSGILAIAAVLRGATRVVGTDNDPEAIRVAKENAAANGVALELHVADLDAVSGTFDVVIANILLGALLDMAPALAAKVAPGGHLLLSGLLVEQVAEIEVAYVACGLDLAAGANENQWALVNLRRRA